ncbi:T9SS type A sorting domain-containing protein [Draconibacterium sp. IB214405]|uniref:T9SS type A sorting domain-containing protein n=1 Tax=Draconibacterium sp. IB214405 TaxID=3097352 RepID=UPI002A12419B|nr:T9SS type A sorting domain-containing protein [Draconibacterium sp. IB214405]MDX8339951.1 T9SS type A sorting domain-containing protein [Draconibacterium sp. IB214405]
MTKLKHLLIVGFLCLISFGSFSQSINLLTTDGQNYNFESINKIVFSRDNIVFENGDGTDNYYSIFLTKKMYFDQTVTSVSTIEYQTEFSVYPNPTSSTLTISRPETSESEIALIYTITGTVKKQIQLYEQENLVDVSELTPGIYFISIDSEILKFIKQ